MEVINRLKIYLMTMFIGLLVVAQEVEKPKVLHMLVTAEIDPRTNRYTELGLERAEELAVDYIILELDTYGGALNDADDIRTRLLECTIPVYTYINKDAASAGALISIATDSI